MGILFAASLFSVAEIISFQKMVFNHSEKTVSITSKGNEEKKPQT